MEGWWPWCCPSFLHCSTPESLLFAVTLVMDFLLYEHDSRCLQGNFHFSFAIPGNGSVTVSVFLCQLYEKLTLTSFITHGRTQYISLEQKLCQPPYKLFLYIFLSLIMFPTIHCCVCMRGGEKRGREREREHMCTLSVISI